MAVNVYMTLFRKYNAKQLKALEWRYHFMCYGIPLRSDLGERQNVRTSDGTHIVPRLGTI